MTGQRQWKKQDWIRIIMILTEIFAREASVKNKFFTRKLVAAPQSLQAAERQGY